MQSHFQTKILVSKMNDNCIKTEHCMKITFSNILRNNNINNGMPFMLLIK